MTPLWAWISIAVAGIVSGHVFLWLFDPEALPKRLQFGRTKGWYERYDNWLNRKRG